MKINAAILALMITSLFCCKDNENSSTENTPKVNLNNIEPKLINYEVLFGLSKTSLERPVFLTEVLEKLGAPNEIEQNKEDKSCVFIYYYKIDNKISKSCFIINDVRINDIGFGYGEVK